MIFIILVNLVLVVLAILAILVLSLILVVSMVWMILDLGWFQWFWLFGIFGGHSVTCFPYSEAVQDWDGCLSYVNGFLWALLALIRYFKPKICWNGNLINGDQCLMHFFESLRLCDQWAECCSLPKASEYAEGFFCICVVHSRNEIFSTLLTLRIKEKQARIG